jgi:hypothetical protein
LLKYTILAKLLHFTFLHSKLSDLFLDRYHTLLFLMKKIEDIHFMHTGRCIFTTIYNQPATSVRMIVQ